MLTLTPISNYDHHGKLFDHCIQITINIFEHCKKKYFTLLQHLYYQSVRNALFAFGLYEAPPSEKRNVL